MTTYEIAQHFVNFMSPGAMVNETTTRPIEDWDTAKAVEMSLTISERHGARPYGFYFSTRGRRQEDLDSTGIAKSGIYFLGGTVETLQEVRDNPQDRKILLENMEGNHWDQVVTTNNGYLWTSPVRKGDAVLDLRWL